jgi:hypothetical protein
VGRKPDGAGEDGGSNEHAAPHALIGQLDTQRLLHATLETLLGQRDARRR